MTIKNHTIQIHQNRLCVQTLIHDGLLFSHKPALIFLHEGLGSIALWRDFPEMLVRQSGLNGIVYDREGHGRSSPLRQPRTTGYLQKEALEVLPCVLDACGIRAAIPVGHSDGGSIALIAAAAYPDRFPMVIAEAPHVFVEPITLEGIRQANHAYHNKRLREKLMRYHGENTDGLFHAWADTWLADTFMEWHIKDILPHITCPLLLIQGTEDQYGSVTQLETIVRGVRGTAESILIPGCGHVPHHQSRIRVLEEMIRFINHPQAHQAP